MIVIHEMLRLFYAWFAKGAAPLRFSGLRFSGPTPIIVVLFVKS